jgi:hypothetical protein
MPDIEYRTYQMNIQNFLSTSQSQEFSIARFVDVLISAFLRNRKD